MNLATTANQTIVYANNTTPDHRTALVRAAS